ncbi:ethanolamine ammonia-lyase subunit EutC [Ignavigranum ruoffiae]|uniref:Ethanolamine ammonia-lyase small subunit n=1 Tax=Ignavigranum ruoffiae TaxID=89093 RepID=A0A1H9GII9_9LACT|nr:ethanolamine ammonia-lyase subunit EutC [Ignavigranum ruoffiae]SEQ49904.1 Ethanolamine ammonia-lyase light chain [Ignavigranum ruoffiae]
MNEQDLKKMIQDILSEVVTDSKLSNDAKVKSPTNGTEIDTDSTLNDIAEVNIREQYLVPNPVNGEAFKKLKLKTPARLGLWRAGTRYLTEPMLRFRFDHAAAQDAVFNDVSEEFVKQMGFVPVKTICQDKDEYLTRPDYGRKFDEENIDIIEKTIKKNAKVAVLVGDGLSSIAIEANVERVLPSLEQGLKNHGLEMGDILFVKYARVPAMDKVAEVTGAEVVCFLIGERPGLVTAESMSAYMAYKPTVGMPEARRTVISNIHDGGTPAVEAGAYIADTIKKMLDLKKSGTDLY